MSRLYQSLPGLTGVHLVVSATVVLIAFAPLILSCERAANTFGDGGGVVQ